MKVLSFIRKKHESEFYVLPTILVDKHFGLAFVKLLWFKFQLGVLLGRTRW